MQRTKAKKPKKADRLPPLSIEFTSPKVDFHSPIGSWNMDAGICDLIDSGLLHYPTRLGITDRKSAFWMVRPLFLQEAKNALLAAQSVKYGIDTRPDRIAEVQEFIALKHKTEAFALRMETIEILLADAGIPLGDEDHSAARRTAVDFMAKLDKLIETRQASIAPSKTPNADYLMQYFILNMRFIWQFVTQRKAPRTGGKILIKIAAGTWKDFNFPTRLDEADRPMEDWLAERFKKAPLPHRQRG